MIRDAGPNDAPAVAAIWNHVIRETTATFNSEEKSVSEVADAIAERQAEGFAFLVAKDAGQVLGFATTFPFRSGVGYRYTAEHTVHLAPDAKGRGWGRALMDATIAHASQAGLHSLWAGISGENPGAVVFHERCGFEHVARLPEVGYKFGRWFDLVLMQKRL